MQPTVLSKSKIIVQLNDFIGKFADSLLSSGWCARRLKDLGWTAAFGSLFIFTQSYALSLQNIQTNSALGEPLDAVVQINAASGEFLQASCMQAGAEAASGMPAIRGVQLSLSRQLSPGTLRLTTRQPVNEPMSEVVVQIDCPGAPAVKRSFLIMLDPRGVTEAAQARDKAGRTAVASPGSLNPSTNRTRPQDSQLITSNDSRINVTNSRRVAVSSGAPIKPGSSYFVANGDALSTIASRIQGREFGTVWSWAATIEAANPHAFINGNPNELIAGSELYIPPVLAPGTEGLTVPASNQTTARRTAASLEAARVAAQAAASASRYADRFSTMTSDPAATTAPADEAPALPGDAPLAVSVSEQTPNRGAIRAIQPVMVMATSFSSVSKDRLRQRSVGLIQSVPDNLPDFVRGEGEAANDPANRTSANQPDSVPDEPAPEPSQSPGTMVVTKPELGALPAGNRRFSFLGLLTGLGLLAASFFAGWFISRRRADAVVQEEVEARLSEERFRQRIRSDHQDVTEAVFAGGAAAGIQVTEAETDSAAEEDDVETEELAEQVAAEGEAQEVEDVSGVNDAEPPTDNDGPMIEPEVLDIDTTSDHQLADIDLELLERDYAAQTETNTGLEDIASAGLGNKTSIMETSLDMEFPEELKMRREADPVYDSLEFNHAAESLDFDIGGDDRESETAEELSLDLEEAGANIDAHLEELRHEDQDLLASGEIFDTDGTAEMPLDGDGTAELPLNKEGTDERPLNLDATSEMPLNTENTTEMQINTESTAEIEQSIEDLMEELPTDDEFSATATRDAEEFYHLEASSIMNVGELDFEKEADDETNILRFRQRNIRTGTDDASGDDE